MVMTSPISPQRETNVLTTMRKRITWDKPGSGVAFTVGVLPAGSAVVSGGIQVLTAFNSGGTDLVDIGVTGTAAAYASALDVASVGLKALDDLATMSVGYSDTAPLTVTATYTDSNATATAGVGDVIINYVTKP